MAGKLNKKQEQAFRDIDQIQQMSPLDALRSGVGLETPEQNAIRKNIIERKRRDAIMEMSPNLPQQDLGEMRQLGGMAIEKSKAESRQNELNRVKEELSLDDDLANFGDKDAEMRAEAKRKHLEQLLNRK